MNSNAANENAWRHTVANEEHSMMPVGMALKLANMTRAQAIEEAWRNTELQIRDAESGRQAIEDKRSYRRNRNRLYMLSAGFIMALVWPLVTQSLLHMNAGLKWTSAISVTGDLAVTAYALWRKY